jgi:cytochrome c-type protein NapC
MAPVIIGITMALVLVLVFRPEITRARGGKILAFFPLFALPAAAGAIGGWSHLEDSKQTQFCLSCHVMTDYGKSLYIDDPSFVPAAHFQNHRIPTEEACYTCHTNYTLYGDVTSKLRGLRHVYVYYFGKVPEPSEIKLYSSYNNRECLHCHEGARSFEEDAVHTADPSIMASIKSNETSCMSCHDQVHDVGKLGERKFWQPVDEGKPQ